MITALLTVSLCLAAEPVRLAPGTQEVVRVQSLTKVGVGDPNIADVTVSKGELIITARSKGRTTLTMWTAKGIETRVVVVDDGKTTELGKLVKTLVNPSLRVEEFSGRTVIDGMLDSPGELKRLRALVGDDANVTILARLDPRVLPAVAQNITAALHREGLKDAHAACLGQTLVLEGSVADERELHKAQMIADSYAGDLLRR
ncbi:MAG: pilus assembly protein N-terminal domain-containing protein [Archangium sp.]|nr:pilus assembly protein N-terminal domain-containing protein [Archangium sp.]